MTKAQLKRVPYGRKNMPEEYREYQVSGEGPVGMIAEWKKMFPTVEFEIVDEVSQ